MKGQNTERCLCGCLCEAAASGRNAYNTIEEEQLKKPCGEGDYGREHKHAPQDETRSASEEEKWFSSMRLRRLWVMCQGRILDGVDKKAERPE